MPEELSQNPYDATTSTVETPLKRRGAPSARWLSLPFFVIGGAVFTAISAFIYVEISKPSGDFTEMIAIGYALIGTIVGGAIGALVGVAFASGAHHRS